jgi:Tol biopolymer transport system component
VHALPPRASDSTLRLPGGEPVKLTHDSRPKMSPVFSSDGSSVVYGTVPPWDTWEVPVLGGQPRLMLPNSSSLAWIDGGKHLLFSEITGGLHMVVVTTDEGRGQRRVVYAPPSERGMAHHSYLSPDGRWVLIVEMDTQGMFLPCHVIPFQGSDPPRIVGPPAGPCISGAWSVDGKSVYVTSAPRDKTHIWRQRFPGGQPEQVTFGTTEEEGITMAPDGKSFITSVGTQDSMVWLHDEQGDRQVAPEGNAYKARFSSDGKRLYYLYATDQKNGHEVWALDLPDGKPERILPGYSTEDYSVSANGKVIAFSNVDQDGHSSVWIASTDHASAPRKLSSSAPASSRTEDSDSPHFLPNGDLLFRSSAAGANSLCRIHLDGTDRRQIGSGHILDFEATSPEGRWAIVTMGSPGEAHAVGKYALPVEGGDPVLLCKTICAMSWDIHGDFMLFSSYGLGDLGTYVLPVRRGFGLPVLPPKPIADLQDLKNVDGVRFLPQVVDSAVSPTLFAFTRNNIRRNLYRIPLQ